MKKNKFTDYGYFPYVWQAKKSVTLLWCQGVFIAFIMVKMQRAYLLSLWVKL